MLIVCARAAYAAARAGRERYALSISSATVARRQHGAAIRPWPQAGCSDHIACESALHLHVGCAHLKRGSNCARRVSQSARKEAPGKRHVAQSTTQEAPPRTSGQPLWEGYQAILSHSHATKRLPWVPYSESTGRRRDDLYRNSYSDDSYRIIEQ